MEIIITEDQKYNFEAIKVLNMNCVAPISINADFINDF